MGFSKTSAKRDIHGNTSLPQKTRETSNKQPNFTPKATRKRRNEEPQGLFPGGSDSKTSVCYAGDPGSIPESGRSRGEGNGNPLQYSCLENSMDGGAW